MDVVSPSSVFTLIPQVIHGFNDIEGAKYVIANKTIAGKIVVR